jgi:hypothetical protein
MFPDDVSTWRLDHDQTIEAVRSATAQISATDAGNAFLASLTSRRLDLRSALGSFAVARNLPNHPFQPGTDRVFCRICGLPPQPDAIDLNKFNFERFKWGVRSTTI